MRSRDGRIYSVLLSAHIYFLTWSKKGLGYLYPVSLLLLYILITAHTILSTLSFNWALTSDTMIKLSFDPSFWASAASQQAPDSKYMQFLRLKYGDVIAYGLVGNLSLLFPSFFILRIERDEV
ncbi:hypothetical protein D9757_010554 [Collybiopsis confluens]|uniref:Uncharacterized protein n=1 Tax=Collybiopsis confluens TaxID=2823264 RepID=A0A8H5GY38_9AGAR|nr:hypothetical protein D9757_010554 [Collybiopsis confluens]